MGKGLETSKACQVIDGTSARDRIQELKPVGVQTEGMFEAQTPEIAYGDELLPIHPHALDLIPNKNAFKVVLTAQTVTLCCLGNLHKSLSAPQKTKSSANAIISRIIVRWH